MSSEKMTRGSLLGAESAATAATALPLLPGFAGLLSQAAAADTRTGLSEMVDMRLACSTLIDASAFKAFELVAVDFLVGRKPHDVSLSSC